MENIPKNETLFSRNFILTSLSTFTLFLGFYFIPGIGMGSIILGFVLQYFGFQIMSSLNGLIVLANDVLLSADNRKSSRWT